MFTSSVSLKRAALVLVSIGLVAALALWYFAIRTPPIPRRTLRIGFEQVPPVQIRTANGYSGLAVDTVTEAAKRAGISLRWVETGTSSDEAFRRGLVDLWPIMVDLPDRRKHIHFTRPWLHTSHSLIQRPGLPSPDRGFTGRIALFQMPLHVRLARQEFPEAQLVQFRDLTEVVKQVCMGTVDAAFLEDRAALTALRDKPAECGSMALHFETVPGVTLQVGTASTFEAAGAADKIRAEIGNLFRNGTLAVTIGKYSYYGLDDTWDTYDLMEAAERARWVAWGTGLLGLALAVTVWQAATLRQRMRSAAALRESEERFRAIFQQAAVGVAQVNLEGEVKMVNDRYCEVLGYAPGELLGKNFGDKMHPDDRTALRANKRRLVEGETPSCTMETRYVRKDGDITWVKLYGSLVREADGRPKYLVAIVEDITKRKQAEAALTESEKRFRNMADTVPAMIWVSGPDKLCTFFNQRWLTFTGSTLEDSLGFGWSAKVHPDDRERCRANYSAKFDARLSYQTECRFRRADGEYRWVLAAGVPRYESDGTFAGYVGSCTDITDVKRAQEEALSRQKLETLGVLAGGIAHDFNNLLGSILTTSELVLSELSGVSPAHDGVESIKNVADRAAEIVRQMMAYAGRENTVFEPIDISLLVNEMLKLLSVSISKRAQLTVDLPENLPAVRANPAQIRQVVMNLITNASEALGEKDGAISVTLAHVQPGHGPFAESTPDLLRRDHVRLTVSDTGDGMTEEVQARIFDPFFTTKFTGRGLGLAAVQGIIRDHGGTINVVSAPGQGSRFEILLPSTSQPAPVLGDAPVSAPTAGIGRVAGSVLVVEDEEDLRVAVSKMLRRQGFSVMEANNGHAGVDLFQANLREIDVVLLDLTLPGMTGREVFEELRRMRPEVKVVIATAYSQDTARKTLGGQQPWFYIRKPYRIAEITDLLRNVCHARSAS